MTIVRKEDGTEVRVGTDKALIRALFLYIIGKNACKETKRANECVESEIFQDIRVAPVCVL